MSRANRKETIISAGIDIGTSTTKMIISEFTLVNTAGVSHVPRIEIIDKVILYRSPIFQTPLLDGGTHLNMPAIHEIVHGEYEKAGIASSAIRTGAVIITGESATKENAAEMIHDLASEAGEFLVATAGPDLEGIIAAKGSGAYDYSIATGQCVANIDIGGGTANLAVYKAGKLCGTCTLHVGGRLIQFQDNVVTHVSKPVMQWARTRGINNVDMAHVDALLEEMVRTLVLALQGSQELQHHPFLLGHVPDWSDEVEVIMFSGGVSECLYYSDRCDGHYNDIGVKLAQKLKESPALARWQRVTPTETVRATVLGAGTQTTEISGATIQVSPDVLPLKNLPVHRFHFPNGQIDEQIVRKEMEQAGALYDPLAEGNLFALFLSGLGVLRFKDIQQLAVWLVDSLHHTVHDALPIVIVVANDLAKVLGQCIQAIVPHRPVICIDQISIDNGDYLDIGSMLQSEVVPVVVKTLAFHK
ncbi:reactivating factor for ethanolamine ammonia lyase [Fictibacillus macauensis ZFHKF-1]|uniref:Reactivating factor for ethanolamine ammonia lyase n=1 Tax=Fictibacillus macauensis ZFHKF-1 TaxID=1196324 RepID=I8ALI1_9BACL|nr:ethanolamine ammonia-lyase reactivating factor EutA [Fictibacillus macauensis]EIT86767.1 reactivating factor for ethanolamine ammonia lyase [Fictibacillus macauensis ZFHKF-1]